MIFLIGLFLSCFQSKAYASFPIMQGPTSADATQIVVVLPKHKKVTYRLQKDGIEIEPKELKEFSRDDSEFKTEHAFFNGLQSRNEYKLIVYGQDRKILDERTLSTLDPLKRKFRVASVSCSADRFRLSSKLIWKNLVDGDPDVVLLTGDQVYAGLLLPRPPPFVWKRYIQTRQRLPIFRSKKLIPMISTWDDHDVGGDGANREYKWINEASEIYDAFYPRFEIPGTYERGPGVSSIYSVFGVQIIMLDGRSFRAPVKGGKYYVWGKDQFDWIKSEINKDPSPVFLVNGTQFFTPYGESILQEDRATLLELQRLLKKHSAPTVFFSGDVHYSEIIKIPFEEIGYQTYEITSSAIHSYAMPFRVLPKNKNRLASATEHNFIMADVEVNRDQVKFQNRCVNLSKTPSFELNFTVEK